MEVEDFHLLIHPTPPSPLQNMTKYDKAVWKILRASSSRHFAGHHEVIIVLSTVSIYLDLFYEFLILTGAFEQDAADVWMKMSGWEWLEC